MATGSEKRNGGGSAKKATTSAKKRREKIKERLQPKGYGYSVLVIGLLSYTGTDGHTTNAECFMMEFDPHYCDVIIARWEKLTGKTAEKVS